jgi:hypothetical protein
MDDSPREATELAVARPSHRHARRAGELSEVVKVPTMICEHNLMERPVGAQGLTDRSPARNHMDH